MPKQLIPKSNTVTLENVFQSLQHWRNNKTKYPGRGIPNKIWTDIFILAGQDGYTSKSIRKLFNLNTQQYNQKHQSLMEKQSSEDKIINNSIEESKQISPAITFGEAVVTSDVDIPRLDAATDKTKKAMKTLKSTAPFETNLLDPTTAVVECIRADGHRLKIHITALRLEVLMQTFLNQISTS